MSDNNDQYPSMLATDADVLAIRSSLRDYDGGHRGRPVSQVINELRLKFKFAEFDLQPPNNRRNPDK